MDYEVVWTEEARDDFDSIVNHLTENTTAKSVGKFVRVFYRKLDILTQMPYMGVKSAKREGVRRLLVTKRYSLIYVVIVDQLYLLRVYDNRSDPDEMTF